MQKFMKVPFKMTEKLSHTLGGGLEIWASIIIMYHVLMCMNMDCYFVMLPNPKQEPVGTG